MNIDTLSASDTSTRTCQNVSFQNLHYCKYSNRKYCGNSQFNMYSVCSTLLTTVTKETKGVVQTVHCPFNE